MANTQRRFPTLPLIVLGIGLTVIVVVVVFSFLIIPKGTTAVSSFAQVKTLADQYIGTGSDLKVVEIMEFQNNFYVIVQEKSTGINAYELLVDRSGNVYPEMGPNMMWNRKYGMMGGYGSPAAIMPVAAQRAAEIAQNWLDANIQGATVLEPQTFYGYYTIDISLNGKIYGMLSVNGYSGDVWYHTWHGQFVAEKEYD